MHDIAQPTGTRHDDGQDDDGRIRLELCSPGALPPDARTVLVRVGPAAPGEAQAGGWAAVVPLAPPAPAAFGHGAACGCCVGRAGIGALLGDLFRRRATGGIAWFARVVIMADAAYLPALRRDVSTDIVVRARYRAADAHDGGNA
ncbi:hypothetical protein CFR73_06160 [Novacetimonas maltaceti]|uniref:Uncharacterized protein n=1 Tax=Novacetimonas maltaceti TaxID=1203393 RepID=A0A2S3VZT0_9PROT|nr:hypothetical protein [Novacetimonas maltaceti]POF62078.1 hypothetical protein KMAL_23000 [Novacetimonas maltaceti]PYD60562.1 hypothetical protein CFR73_06160 [Novacetimonas maltaceti]